MLQSDEPLWPNGQGACLRSRRFTVRVCAVVPISSDQYLLSQYFFFAFLAHNFALSGPAKVGAPEEEGGPVGGALDLTTFGVLFFSESY